MQKDIIVQIADKAMQDAGLVPDTPITAALQRSYIAEAIYAVLTSEEFLQSVSKTVQEDIGKKLS